MGLVFIPASADKELTKTLSSEQRKQCDAALAGLKTQPLRGDLLHPKGLRELKFSGKRVYFITDGTDVLVLGAGKKNTQHAQITSYVLRIKQYLYMLKKLSKRHNDRF